MEMAILKVLFQFKTYNGIKVVKRECLGHVQKKLGTHLQKLKKETKGIGGKRKLTNAIIDKLQNYYGLAIRKHVGNKQAMKKTIMSGFAMWHLIK